MTVNGRIDRDKGEKTSIEASSVFVKGLSTFFYASASDEEDVPVFLTIPRDDDSLVVQGTVTQINDREFTLSNAGRNIVVDTKLLDYNPMDNRGYQQIRIGDVVRVYGEFDEGTFERDEVHPVAIVTLRKF